MARSLGRPLPKQFYARDTVRVARDLLGCVLETTIDGHVTGGRIVEVEAYLGAEDPAAHSYGNRKTTRNASMFGPPGRAYVYRSYGIHWCVNVVTQPNGVPSAVLVRALEPVRGLEVMRQRRDVGRDRLLCSGPGRLCQALGITGEHDGTDLGRRPVRVLGQHQPGAIAIETSHRIGISKASDWPLRFTVEGSRWLSR